MPSEQPSTSCFSTTPDSLEKEGFILLGEVDGVFCYENREKQIGIRTRVKGDMTHGVILGPIRRDYEEGHFLAQTMDDDEWPQEF